MKTSMILAIALLMSAGVSNSANAYESGTWLVRSRLGYIAPSVKTTTLDIDVKTSQVPEFDFTYFVANNISLELILGMARHQVNLGGSYLGSVNVLPPTLTAQYHFKDLLGTSFDPYAGIGLNYTLFLNSNLPVFLKKSSIGPSFQAGVDVPLKGDVFLNVDLKKILIATDISATDGSAVLDTLKINPWVYGIGIGFKI